MGGIPSIGFDGCTGMLLMISAHDLIALYMGLELQSCTLCHRSDAY